MKTMDTKGHFLPFVTAFVVCMAAFILLDTIVMNMQGLSLMFNQ